MKPYVSPTAPICHRRGCYRHATHQVIDRDGESVGSYCADDAKFELVKRKRRHLESIN